MQTSNLPKQVCEELDKKCRNFIWGSSQDHRKVHLVSWKEVCKPKLDGGLGMRQSTLLNTANMMKVGWNIMNKKDDLWVRVIRSKYGCGDDIIPKVNKMVGGSNLWNGVSSC